MNYINTVTQEVKRKREIVDSIKAFTSLGPNTLAELNWTPVMAAPKPAPSTNLKHVASAAPVQDANGNWVQGYIERDMFADTVEDGVTTTKAEHEAAHIAKLDADATQATIDTAIREFEEETAAMTANYSQAEIDTFPTQEAEAAVYMADNTAPTPLLDAILSESGEVKAELVTKIQGNAAALKVGAGKAIGRKKKKIKDA